MDYQLLKPQIWEKFEELCCDLWKSIWGDPNTQMHGRRGQSQNGIDVIGLPAYSNRYHGVQCKGKDDNKLSSLSIDEINAECNKATNIQPPIGNFVMATTANRDKNLQQYCRKLTEARTYPFTVSVWAWEDISQEIQNRPDLLRKYYSDIMDLLPPSDEFVIDIDTNQDKLAAFLTRPIIKEHFSLDLLQLMYPLVCELIANAFIHGHAGRCKIQLKDNRIEIRDNGAPYDFRNLLQINGRGGANTLCVVKAELQDDLELEWFLDDNNENVTALVFKPDVMKRPLSDLLELTLDYTCSFGRDAGLSQAVAHMRTIPSFKKKIIVNVNGMLGVGTSFGGAYFERICSLLGESQEVVAYIPKSATALFKEIAPLQQTYPLIIKVRE